MYSKPAFTEKPKYNSEYLFNYLTCSTYKIENNTINKLLSWLETPL